MMELRAAPPVAVRERATVPVETVADPKIDSRHLLRQALIYVRQSHPNQVQRHPESARRQYQLVERAERLGWGRAPPPCGIGTDVGRYRVRRG